MQTVTKSKRIDITLPVQTIDQIDTIRQEFGFASRSSFIDIAARQFALRLKKADMKRKLKYGYLERAERDSELTRQFDILSLDHI